MVWAGYTCTVYDVDGFLILHSGRPVPGTGEKVERNEGVGIVMDPSMVSCWKNGGEVWNPVSSRIVSARLKLSDQAAVAPTRGRSQPLFVSVVSVYAPTHRASQEDKDQFFDDLQGVADGISTDELLLIVGDFNARVRCGEKGDSWDVVCGCHGVGCVNANG